MFLLGEADGFQAPRWQPAAHLLDHNRDHCLSRREFDHAFGGHTRLPRVRGVRVGGWEEMQLLTAAWAAWWWKDIGKKGLFGCAGRSKQIF